MGIEICPEMELKPHPLQLGTGEYAFPYEFVKEILKPLWILKTLAFQHFCLKIIKNLFPNLL